jgi:hypothetical protein
VSVFTGINKSASAAGAGGNVTITQSSGSTVAATGAGSMGIFAQSAGNGITMVTKIGITVDGTVTGGSGSEAAGIYVSGGSNVTGGFANTITIGSVGTVNGTSGMAIRSISDTTNVNNNGTITGPGSRRTRSSGRSPTAMRSEAR